MNVKIVDLVQGDLREEAWTLYSEAFKELNALAVQRHLMYRNEFDEVMGDPRIQKYLCLDLDDALRGLSIYTNQLDAVPLISPQYFERRWPAHYADQRIWYCGFVATQQDSRAATAFGDLVSAMYFTAAGQNGLIALDFCNRTDEVRRMSRVVRLMLHRLSGDVRAERIDEQQYWLYDFPSAG
ncbi:hypothetical protein ACFFX1_17050 [Dactylosporangium sucinum]|uniref:Uncharacterized protein n=1 Tax=Dactylosporangium sucinum TaxID=1424081 RepID=A0A917U679_9ACTN|nr:hypothetical protein [Dactylosporangium sucinum]GGM57877.1 hypothetical protein GCM10007977_069380 [Dactylosporangium sucinum]